MALRRRSGARFEGSVWPGFVDAMTALLLVLIFVLSIFMIIQFVLRDLVSGKEEELDSLTRQLAEVAQVLSMERDRGDRLADEVSSLSASLREGRAEIGRLETVLSGLREERDRARARNEALSAEVEGLESDLAGARDRMLLLRGELADVRNARDEAARSAEGAEPSSAPPAPRSRSWRTPAPARSPARRRCSCSSPRSATRSRPRRRPPAAPRPSATRWRRWSPTSARRSRTAPPPTPT